MSMAEIAYKLHHPLQGQLYHLQASCATSGDGLYEGLDWLSDTLHQLRKGEGAGGNNKEEGRFTTVSKQLQNFLSKWTTHGEDITDKEDSEKEDPDEEKKEKEREKEQETTVGSVGVLGLLENQVTTTALVEAA